MTDQIPAHTNLLTLDPAAAYVLEFDMPLTQRDADLIKARFLRATGCDKVGILGPGVRIARDLDGVYEEIRDEREGAHAKHGSMSMELQPPTSLTRLAILVEEVGEVAREFNEAAYRPGTSVDPARLRAELIQVAAMAAAWAGALTGIA